MLTVRRYDGSSSRVDLGFRIRRLAFAADGAASGAGDAAAITKRWIPNPLRKGSMIEWSANRAPITLEVYDISGRLLRTVRDEGQHGGIRFIWDGRGDNGRTLGTGLYLLRISQGRSEWTRKVISFE